jgi:hypothetical protein
MSGVPLRLGMFAGALALVFGAAAALGAVVRPGTPAASCAPMAGGAMGHEAFGLSMTQDETSIAPSTFSAVAGEPRRLRFQILTRDGSPLRSGYEVEAERRMHLIVVRRDLTGYQHLHPTLGRDGTWSVSLTVPLPGAYRVFADFQLSCQKHVLAADLLAPGDFQPRALPRPSATASVDGYGVRLHAPVLRAGDEAHLSFQVTRHGQPVAEIEPYLGARGHLVALRRGDLAYLHVHPEERHFTDPGDTVAFAADFLSAGSYRLFLQFKLDGVVHTAPFTVEVAP